jgi:hypothetical protein
LEEIHEEGHSDDKQERIRELVAPQIIIREQPEKIRMLLADTG